MSEIVARAEQAEEHADHAGRAAVHLYPEKRAVLVRFAYCPRCPENACKGHLLRVWGEAS